MMRSHAYITSIVCSYIYCMCGSLGEHQVRIREEIQNSEHLISLVNYAFNL